MNKRLLFLTILLITALGLISYKITHAFFSDTAQSTNNTFAASEVFPTATPSATPTITIALTQAPINPGGVVINEIMWMGSSAGSNDEWLELKNTTSNPIDLTGWKLEGAATGATIITIPSGTISAGGFFLISNFDEATSSSILNIAPDFVTTSVQLDNSGLQIKLKDASDVIIDTADDDSGDPFAGSNVSPRKSMERNDPPGNGTILTNWHTATSAANLDPGAEELATPRAANSL